MKLDPFFSHAKPPQFISEGAPYFCHMFIFSGLAKYLTVMRTEDTGYMLPDHQVQFQLKPSGAGTGKVAVLSA